MSGRPARWLGIGLILTALTALLGYLAWRFPGVLDDRDSQIRLVQATLLLSVFLLPSLFYRQLKARQMFGYAAIWLGLGFVLFAGYAFRDEAASVFQRLAGELVPGAAQVSGSAMEVRMGRDGHFAVEAQVDGVGLMFLVDTGASDVVLSPADARRLGFDLEKLDYSKTYRTANGLVKGAPVTLGQVTIGSIQVNGVSASVNGADMNRSLLGMSYLRRLSGFEINGNSLILSP
ncbi:MAG: TIGR02281 family clan AA aspartic protease [Rhodospirillales bacterium]|nr:TIGR02281 family clan AA aspartic protease [Rhodospirillales bacterium]